MRMVRSDLPIWTSEVSLPLPVNKAKEPHAQFLHKVPESLYTPGYTSEEGSGPSAEQQTSERNYEQGFASFGP